MSGGRKESGSAEGPPGDLVFSQRIVNMDFYMGLPFGQFDVFDHQEGAPRVPVLRIFGATPRGQKTCTHVHGVFPYLTVKYDFGVEGFEDLIVKGINQGLNDALNQFGQEGGRRKVQLSHVFRARKVVGKTFYGYRNEDEMFLRIYFFNPRVTKKVAEMLGSGSVLGRKIQPYDAHIPFHLQFMIDYNLYGMNLVHYKAVKFRKGEYNVVRGSLKRSGLGSFSGSGVGTVWDLKKLPESLFSELGKTVVSELEVDVCAADIAVVLSTSNSYSSNPGIEAIWRDEIARRRAISKSDEFTQIEVPDSPPRNFDGEMFSTEALCKKILLDNLDKAEVRQGVVDREVIPPTLNDSMKKTSDGINSCVLNSTIVDHYADKSMTNAGSEVDLEQNNEEMLQLIERCMAEGNIVNDFVNQETPVILDGALNGEEDFPEQEQDLMEDEENEAPSHRMWSQSFMQTTLLELENDLSIEHLDDDQTEDSLHQVTSSWDIDANQTKSKNRAIPQGDGLNGSSEESDSELTPKRRSVRSRNLPAKLKDSALFLKKKTKGERPYKTGSETSSQPISVERQIQASGDSTVAVKRGVNRTIKVGVAPCPRSKKPANWVEAYCFSNPIVKLERIPESVLRDLQGTNHAAEIPFESSVKHVNTKAQTLVADDKQNTSLAAEVTSEMSVKSRRNLKRKRMTRQSFKTSLNISQAKDASEQAEIQQNHENVEDKQKSSNEDVLENVEDIHKSSHEDVAESTLGEIHYETLDKSVNEALNLNESSRDNPAPELLNPAELVSDVPKLRFNSAELGSKLPTKKIRSEMESGAGSQRSISVQTETDYFVCSNCGCNNSSVYQHQTKNTNATSPQPLPLSSTLSQTSETVNDRPFSDVDSPAAAAEEGILNLMSTEKIHSPSPDTETTAASLIAPLVLSPISQYELQSSSSPFKDRNKTTPETSKVTSAVKKTRGFPSAYYSSPSKQYRGLLHKALLKNRPAGRYRNPLPFMNRKRILPSSTPSGNHSFFEVRRSASRSKSRQRRLEVVGSLLEVNFHVRDIFRHEYEPLKEPPCYSMVEEDKKGKRFLRQMYIRRKTQKVRKPIPDYEQSSPECSPIKTHRLAMLGSEDEDSDNDNMLLSPEQSQRKSDYRTPVSQNRNTPRSILRPPSGSARQKGAHGKRKIQWDEGNQAVRKDVSKVLNNSELDGPTPRNGFGFEHDMSNLKDAKAFHQCQFITVLSMELHCESHQGLIPNPLVNKILGIYVSFTNDYPDGYEKPQNEQMRFLLIEPGVSQQAMSSDCTRYFGTEFQLLQGFLEFYHSCDPDIIVGYEIERSSWGYLVQRGKVTGIDFITRLSRLLPLEPNKQMPDQYQPKWEGNIVGRITLNLWRLMRKEIAVQSYSYENVVYHVLHRRVSRFSPLTLTQFWNSHSDRWRVLQYFTARCQGSIDLISVLDLVNRTSELARLFGILFYEVFSRGSQFRVESMMLRISKSQNLIPVSPGVSQRAQMRAPEFVPLILEPISNYYTDPVAVLDFQSLYPSMMIAYNYDYSTVLGRVEYLGSDEHFEMGCIGNEVSRRLLKSLKDSIHISPAGVAFVKASVRKGILPEMLEQILETRQMVKRSMKKWKHLGSTLQKILDSRQLGLKLIANVSYGYTSANWSGRMPCVDIADSIVSKGRETLQRAIDHVKVNYDKYGGEVVYGDTDSMFVLFRGKTRMEAFTAARAIADDVTQMNPKPVKLKFEKIYDPCILQSKKRYVGYSYESEEQTTPLYDAKGIETVRRDGCPSIKKILEKALHILFTTNNSTKVQNFVQLQFKKLFLGRVSMKDYIFAREYRGRDGYKPGACVPSLEIAKKQIQLDPLDEPLTKERVPYVIIYDKPSLPLIQLVRTPMEFAMDYTLRLNAHYYIEKAIIPALNRCLLLANMDAVHWYKALPRKYLRNILDDKQTGQGTLDDYFHHANCPRCDEPMVKGVCAKCESKIQEMTSFLVQTSADLTTKLDTACQICVMCCGDDDLCDNTDCPVFHKLLRYERDEYYNRRLLDKIQAFEI